MMCDGFVVILDFAFVDAKLVTQCAQARCHTGLGGICSQRATLHQLLIALQHGSCIEKAHANGVDNGRNVCTGT